MNLLPETVFTDGVRSLYDILFYQITTRNRG